MPIKDITPQGCIQCILCSDLAWAQHEVVLVSLYKWQRVRANIYAERLFGQPISAPSDGDENPCSNRPRTADQVLIQSQWNVWP